MFALTHKSRMKFGRLRRFTLHLSIKTKLTLVIVIGVVAITFTVIQYSYNVTKKVMIEDINRQIKNTTLNAWNEMNFIFRDVEKGRISEMEAREIINEKFSGKLSQVFFNLPLEKFNSTLFEFLNKNGFQKSNYLNNKWLVIKPDKIESNNSDEQELYLADKNKQIRIGKVSKEKDKIKVEIDFPEIVTSLYKYYLSLSPSERYILETDFFFRIIRDNKNTIIKIGEQGYVWGLTSLNPDWLIRGTVYPDHYSLAEIKKRFASGFHEKELSIPLKDYFSRFGNTAEKQKRWIDDYMSVENNPPLPIYDEFHPSLFNINTDNATNYLGERVGRQIAVRKNGFYSYEWKNPTDENPRKKIVFMKLFEFKRKNGSVLSWVICTGGYEDEAYSGIVELQNMMFLLSVTISAVFAFIIIIFVNYNLLTPLANLLSGVREVNGGNLDIIVPVKFKDEIGYLSESFNSMVRSIDKANRELVDYTQQLDVKVMERTKELNSTLNIIKRDLNTAQKIQQNILSKDHQISGLQIYSKYFPMTEVGGDFFNIQEIEPNHVRIFIADATGHGVQAAMITFAIKSEYENISQNVSEPAEVLRRLNLQFTKRYGSLQTFFSCFLIDIHLLDQKLVYSSGGHPDQILLTDGKIHKLTRTGRLIGITENSEYEEVSLKLNKSDKLFLFTDGVFEEFDSDEQEFGEERLYQIILKNGNRPIEKIVTEILLGLEKYLSGEDKQDDLTLIALCPT